MKNLVKIAVITLAVQAGLANAAPGAALQSGAARPVAVNIAVGELSDASGAISGAVASGDNYKAEELLSKLYSGGLKAEKAAPVYAEKCCPYAHHAAPAPAAGDQYAAAPAAPAVNEPPAGTMTAAQRAEAQMRSIRAMDAARAEKEKADKEKKAKDEAESQKKFNLGITILTVALLILILL
ncbi:MAG: hypothetical protein CVU79_07910 [Elusimicrobia bacterium HGW-Elusimicrobia-3]|jgi:hypothetical protein|nr:MAG: hypothetical protein CVU79_07910 [Elusimicrobia bacterium HGW-Elusimicrobia-3]